MGTSINHTWEPTGQIYMLFFHSRARSSVTITRAQWWLSWALVCSLYTRQFPLPRTLKRHHHAHARVTFTSTRLGPIHASIPEHAQALPLCVLVYMLYTPPSFYLFIYFLTPPLPEKPNKSCMYIYNKCLYTIINHTCIYNKCLYKITWELW